MRRKVDVCYRCEDGVCVHSRLGSRIATLRKAMGYTQQQLASEGGMSLRHVQDVEAGKSDVKLSMICRFAKALQMEVYQLLSPVDVVRESTGVGDVMKKSSPCFDSFALLDRLSVGLLVFDVQGLVYYSNLAAAEILGCRHEEIIGRKHLWDFVADAESKEALQKHLRFWTSEQPKPSPFCWTIQRESNASLRTRLDWSYICDGEGKVIAFFSALHNCHEVHYVPV